jgi:DNA polymerase III gamma/tau subunit
MREPDLECSAVKDIVEQRFNRSVTCYNGGDLTVDKMRELNESLAYDSLIDENTVLIIEEAQMINSTAMKQLLTILEMNRPHTYVILTSTDEAKFSNSYGKDNSTREKNALRSRISLYKLNNITTDEISDYLFQLFTTKIDPDGQMGDAILELIPYIAQNSKNNLRQALNDLSVAIDSECTSKDDLIKLLNYTDDEKESEIVISLLNKDKSALCYINNKLDNLADNVPYWYKILSNNALRDMIGEPFDVQWKEKSFSRMKSSGNLLSLYNVFNKTQQLCGAYFNPNVFVSMLYEYYNGNKTGRIVEKTCTEPSTQSVKKVKKIVR